MRLLAPTLGLKKHMEYPEDANGDVFRRMEEHSFDFSIEHIVDFHAVFASEGEADQIALMFVADHDAGDKYVNIETKPYDEGGMELTLSKNMLVTYKAIYQLEKLLSERVSSVEGYLDGWGVLQE
jgi:Regulator of ribonuclease activity B